jgi:hypothetical protein
MTDSGALISQLEAEYCQPLGTATFLAILSDFDIRSPDSLQAELCPPLGTTTLLAILSDFDIRSPAGLQSARARQILDSLLPGVDAEEATGFDPTGSSRRDGINKHTEAESDSEQSQRGWRSNTHDTSLSQGMSAPVLEFLEFSGSVNVRNEEMESHDEQQAKIYSAHLENLDDTSREAVLTETVP